MVGFPTNGCLGFAGPSVYFLLVLAGVCSGGIARFARQRTTSHVPRALLGSGARIVAMVLASLFIEFGYEWGYHGSAVCSSAVLILLTLPCLIAATMAVTSSGAKR